MRHTSVIRRISLEPNGEDIILVVPCYMQVLCPSLLMLQMNCCQLQLRHMFRTLQRETKYVLSWLWVLVDVCY